VAHPEPETENAVLTAYLTHDEVNARTAHALAERLGLALVVLDVRGTHPAAARLVCDLDHLPSEVKFGLLTNAQSGISLSAVALHSYHLSPDEVQLLRAAGAQVSRRLTAVLLAAPVPAVRCG
jgi:hypothetical protein